MLSRLSPKMDEPMSASAISRSKWDARPATRKPSILKDLKLILKVVAYGMFWGFLSSTRIDFSGLGSGTCTVSPYQACLELPVHQEGNRIAYTLRQPMKFKPQTLNSRFHFLLQYPLYTPHITPKYHLFP